MPTVTADFPTGAESGTLAQLATLVSDFSPDFTVDFTGGAGAGTPIEWGISVYGLMSDTAIESTAVASTKSDTIWPIEFSSMVRGGRALAEWLALSRLDTMVSDELIRSQVADPPASAEVLRAQTADPPGQTESSAAMRLSDAMLPTEAAGTIVGGRQAVLEAQLSARSDNAPIEWAALFRTGLGLPRIETSTNAQIDPMPPGESLALSRLDNASAIEAVSAAATRSDAILPIEALLLAVRDGAYLELGTSARLGPSLLPTEAIEIVRVDPVAPAEATGNAARADFLAPIEATLSLAIGPGFGPPGEFLATLRALVVTNSQGPIEWAGSAAAARAALGVEWAALSSSDRSAIVELLRAIAADWQTPSESAMTMPPPLLFVSRGRLR